MEIPFYKMHIGGNGFILIDLARVPQLTGLEAVPLYAAVARLMCERTYGVGAAGCIFLAPDNSIRFFSNRGKEADYSGDALLCAARFAFDSGRITRSKDGTENLILFHPPKGEISLRVIGAHEFSLNLGSPFSAITGAVITPDSPGITEIIDVDDRSIRAAAIHVQEDVLAVFPGTTTVSGTHKSSRGGAFKDLAKALRGHLSGRPVHIVTARTITRETLVIRTAAAGMSAACATAAAAVILCTINGLSDKNAVAVFSDKAPESAVVPGADPDNSRRIAILWDTETNELTAIGTGGYLFEGIFIFPDEQKVL
jgi:diaminopimelate epimerase